LKSPANFDFAKLDKQLSVKVSIEAREHAILADKEFKSFTLASAETNENVVSRCVLIHLTLANGGPSDVAVTAVLSAAELRAPNGQTWPDEANKAERGYYAAITGRWENIDSRRSTKTPPCCSSPTRFRKQRSW
jgi:hypothetical protein